MKKPLIKAAFFISLNRELVKDYRNDCRLLIFCINVEVDCTEVYFYTQTLHYHYFNHFTLFGDSTIEAL